MFIKVDFLEIIKQRMEYYDKLIDYLKSTDKVSDEDLKKIVNGVKKGWGKEFFDLLKTGKFSEWNLITEEAEKLGIELSNKDKVLIWLEASNLRTDDLQRLWIRNRLLENLGK